MLSQPQICEFQSTILDYYNQNRRKLPWREGEIDPYQIMVSEVMLQQTQAGRVIEKYVQFLEAFPTVAHLAKSSLNDVLAVWHGLGYNRRGRYLRDAARYIEQEYGGKFPRTVQDLTVLPGIGHNTASAILVYAYNQPLVFIETNIRTVYLHHFFPLDEDVSDEQVLELVAQTLDHENPREWYWALMDYGTYLKKTHGNANRRSKHYARQSTFEGSDRQLRGQILREVIAGPTVEEMLIRKLGDPRASRIVDSLVADKLIKRQGKTLRIAD